jgi:hypothetical protein
MANVLQGGSDVTALVVATLGVPLADITTAMMPLERADAVVAWARRHDRLDALAQALFASFPEVPSVREAAALLDEGRRRQAEVHVMGGPLSQPMASPPNVPIAWESENTGRVHTTVQPGPTVGAPEPPVPVLAARPTTELDRPWFTAYRPAWVLRRVSFTLHLHIVPRRDDLDAIDGAARAAIGAAGNPAERVEGVALRRDLRAGEALTGAVDGAGVSWGAVASHVWNGERMKLTLRGVVDGDTAPGRHVLVLRVLARSVEGVDEVLGEADLVLTVKDRPPTEHRLRLGVALTSALTTLALALGSARFELSPSLGGAGSTAAVVLGALALRPILAPALPPTALYARPAPSIPPRRADPTVLAVRLERGCSRLDGPGREKVRDALAAAFPSYAELDQLTDAELRTPLAHVAAPGPLLDVVFELLRWCESRGRTAHLIAAAAARRRDHPTLAALVVSLSSDAARG